MTEPTTSTAPTDPFSMTAEQAAAQLTAMTSAQSSAGIVDAPKTPEEAGQKLEQLWNDPAWRNRFEAGHSATRQEFEDLLSVRRQSATVEEIAAGRAFAPLFETVGPGELSTADKISAADQLSEFGIPPEGIKHVIGALQPGAKSPFTEADVEWARSNKERLMQTQEWVDRLLKGDYAARHALIGLSAIIAAGAAE